MKSKHLLFALCFILCSTFIIAQNRTETKSSNTSTNISASEIDKLPFSRGMNMFTIQRNLNYTHAEGENSNQSANNFDFKIDYNRFIVDHVGVGIDFGYTGTKTEDAGTFKDHRWMGYLNLIYGTSASGNFNIYGKASVGFGKDKQEFNSGLSSGEIRTDLFGYRFQVGVPIRMFSDGDAYFTPHVRYNFLRSKEGSFETKESRFEFGFGFENYSSCSDHGCDRGRRFSMHSYEQGRSFIGVGSMGDFHFGNEKTTYAGSTDKSDISGGDIDVTYGYYIIPNLALGAEVAWNSQTQKSGSSKYTSSLFQFAPMLTGNVPVTGQLNNLFLEAGAAFGTSKSEFGSSTEKDNISGFFLDLGFNHFFSNHLACTPKVGYNWVTFKDSDTDVKTKYNGWQFGLGVSMHF